MLNGILKRIGYISLDAQTKQKRLKMNKTRKRVAFYKWYEEKKARKKERLIFYSFVCCCCCCFCVFIFSKSKYLFGLALLSSAIVTNKQFVCILFSTLFNQYVCLCDDCLSILISIGHWTRNGIEYIMDSLRRLITNPNDLCLIENNVKHWSVST